MYRLFIIRNYLSFSLHSLSLNPTKTKLSPTTSGRLTSIPSVARSFNCSSSDILGSFVLSSIDLYNSPDVLKNFLSGSPLILCQAASSSKVGLSSFISRIEYSILLSSSQFFCFLTSCTFGVTNKFYHNIFCILISLSRTASR